LALTQSYKLEKVKHTAPTQYSLTLHLSNGANIFSTEPLEMGRQVNCPNRANCNLFPAVANAMAGGGSNY